MEVEELELVGRGVLNPCPGLPQPRPQGAAFLAAGRVQQIVNVTAGNLVDMAELPGLDGSIDAHHPAVSINQADHVWQRVSRAFPILLGAGDDLLKVRCNRRAPAVFAQLHTVLAVIGWRHAHASPCVRQFQQPVIYLQYPWNVLERLSERRNPSALTIDSLGTCV